jgi:hypothetical protein
MNNSLPPFSVINSRWDGNELANNIIRGVKK